MDNNPSYVSFKQARQYTVGRRGSITGWTVHSMEAPEKGSTAESTANYFTVITRPASAHYNFDADSEVQSVRDKDTAYHAPGVNHCHLGAEHAGYARQTPQEWHDPYSWAMLQRSAVRLKAKAAQYGFPIRYLDRTDLKRGHFSGITTHNEVSHAFGKSTHWDPGPGFPMADYLDMASRGLHVVQPPKPTLVLKYGDKGPAVSFLRAMLTILAPVRINSKGKQGGGSIKDKPADLYGSGTMEAVRELQRFGRQMGMLAKLPAKELTVVDGIAGDQVAALVAYWVPQVLAKK